MNSLILIGVLTVLPTVLLLLFRVNAAVVFFSLCAGSVLANQLSGDAALVTSGFIKDGDLNNAVVSIGLTVLPALLSAFILRASIKSSKLLFNLVPSVAVGALLALLTIPLLPSGQQNQFTNNQVWSNLEQYEPVILIAGTISSIVLLLLTQARSKKDKKRKK